MKTAIQLTACAVALTGLLWGAAAQATNLAELPLKASVLAKPNVVFVMDDSGSMDWEMALGSDSGITWWNGSSSFDGTTHRPLNSSDYDPYEYLFPVGTASGGAIYAYNNFYGRAAPPTAQFAWLRSPTFNPLYYNTNVNYSPWAPAYVNGSYVSSYPAASTSAATSHPAVSGAQTLNLGADWDSTNANFSTNGFRFFVQPGMTLPVGSYLFTTAADATGTACSGSTARTLTAAQTVAGTRTCYASIPYYPATFWNAEACTVDGSTCVTAPDGTTKLKRYEIKSGTASYPSGRTYANELQNFANWFSYHRKRKLLLAAAMGQSLENITGLRMAVMPFNSSPTLTMYDSDSTNNAINRHAISGQFYLNSMTSNGTPTHAAMSRAGGQFDSNTGIIQYACQRNSMFVVTDGFANDTATAPSYNASTYGSTAPYTTTATNSLADFALAYYTNRPRTDLPAGRVPSGNAARVNPDLNTNLHVTTYGITIGARGTLYPTATNPFATDIFTAPPTWPTPVADDPTMVDDLWHAAVNGRGQMFLATDITGLTVSLRTAFNDILSQAGAQGGVAVSAINLDRSDSQAYLGVYNPSGWAGDLTANPINISTGAVSSSSNWLAAAVLAGRDWTTRVVFTASGSSGVDFSTTNVGATVNPNSASFTNQAVVEYLRGNRSGEGTTFRPRTSLIGAIVNSEPVLARDDHVVYMASGEGMLHAFDTATGAEQWAFVPPDQLAPVGAAVQRGWVYQTLLDASPALATLSSGSKLLVGGLGAAGRSYYALDVSSPRGLTSTQAAAQFRWVFPATSDTTLRAKMGYTVGKPVITRTAADGDVVLVASGFDNGQTIGDGKGRLWLLNASTGAVIKTFRTTVGTTTAEAGLAYVSAFKENDGTTRYVYGGDLLGNLWRFDLTRSGSGDIDAELVASFQDAGGVAQPVTAAPELVMIANKRVILVGTGRVLDIGDFGSTRTQSFYAVADGTTLTNARTGLVRQTYTRSTDTMSANTVNWTSDRGWYFDLTAGEQANTDPVVAYGSVAFVTNVNGSTDCAQSSYMYLIDIGTGTKVAASTFVSQTIATNATSSRVIALRVVSGRIIGTTHRSDNTVYQRELPLGQSVTPSKNAWREIRR